MKPGRPPLPKLDPKVCQEAYDRASSLRAAADALGVSQERLREMITPRGRGHRSPTTFASGDAWNGHRAPPHKNLPAALADIAAGDSIAKACRTHSIDRSTLSKWLKRIKGTTPCQSASPTPPAASSNPPTSIAPASGRSPATSSPA